jgi:hypothetical protein
VASLRARVAVPSGVLTEDAARYPAAVIVRALESPSIEQPTLTRVGVLCAPPRETQRFEYAHVEIGCAYETPVSVFVVPIAKDDPAARACADGRASIREVEGVRIAPQNAPPLPPTPAATGVAFVGRHAKCGSESDRIDLVVEAPRRN